MGKLKWTPRKRRAAFLLATAGKNYTEIADELGITVQTLWNWRQEDKFNRKVGEISARNQRLQIETNIAIRLKAMR